MSSEANEMVIWYMLHAIQKGSSAEVENFIAPNWVNHDPALPPMRGIVGARQLIGLWSGLSDLKVEVEDSLCMGERVAMRFRISGTHSGMLMGIAPSGNKVSISATGIFRVVDGKVTDNWVNFDALGLLQQLGALPLPVI